MPLRLGDALAERVVLGVEGERDEGLEAAGFVLKFAEPEAGGRCGARASRCGRRAWSRSTCRRVRATRDGPAATGRRRPCSRRSSSRTSGWKISAPPPGSEPSPAAFISASSSPRRPLRQPLEPVPLHRRPRLQVQVGTLAVDVGDDAEIPLVGQLVVQARRRCAVRCSPSRSLRGRDRESARRSSRRRSAPFRSARNEQNEQR